MGLQMLPSWVFFVYRPNRRCCIEQQQNLENRLLAVEFGGVALGLSD